jgi:hypothetical protein
MNGVRMGLRIHRLSVREGGRALIIGIATGLILAVLNIIALKSHLSPLPKPLGLAFAETLFGAPLPLPVGLLFHLAWITLFSFAYVILWRNRLTFGNALALAVLLWLAALLVFFPIVGWGFFGLNVGATVILPVTVSHVLFAAILWALARLAFGPVRGRSDAQPRTV